MKKMTKKYIIAGAFAGLIAATAGVSTASAGGIIADVFIRPFSPEGADFADQAHAKFKRDNPDYGKAEEQFTNDVRSSIGLEPHCEPLYNKWGEEVACQ